MIKPQYEINKPYGFIGYDGLWHEFKTSGKYRHKHIGYCRRLRSIQERRWNEAHKEYVRGRRMGPRPNANDDIRPSYAYGSNWKRFTKNKHQWQH